MTWLEKEDMKLEDQVTNLELSKRLKELGVKQESLFWWEFYISGDPELKRAGEQECIEGESEPWYPSKDCISAFTVAELGEMLPKNIEDKESDELGYLEIHHDLI